MRTVRFRYGVRTLLVLTAIVGGWCAFHANRAHYERKVEAELARAGGKVTFGVYPWKLDNPPSGPTGYDRFAMRVFGERHIVGVELRNSKVTRELGQLVARLPYLQSVWISDSQLEEGAAREICKSSELCGLGLSRTNTSDTDLERISGLKELRTISLDETQIGDKTFRAICALPRVESVSVIRTSVSGNDVPSLACADSLRFFYGESTNIGNNFAALLAKCTRLETAYLERTRITDEGVDQFRNHPALSNVILSSTSVTNQSLDVLETLPSLKFVEVSGTKVTPGALRTFQSNRPQVRL